MTTGPPGMRKLAAKDEAKKVINSLFKSNGKDRSPIVRKKMKASKVIAKMLNGNSSTVGKGIDELSSEEDPDSDDSNPTDNGIEELPKDKKEQDNLLTDAFKKLYSNFNEDDVEMGDDILKLLDVLKTRGCVTKHEYEDIKSRLKQRMNLNLYESINSTVENMTRADEREVLEFLRSMNSKEVAELMGVVKDYFEKEVELESVLESVRKMKDKVDAMKIEIILKEIQKTRERVNKIFTQLANGSDKMDILNHLRSADLITDEQKQKLAISPHTLPSISRIIQGKGLYLSRHWR